MNILIINYFYYPMVDAHVYKWMAIENELIKLGHNVDFIHSSFNNYEENKNIKTVSLVIIFKKISQFLKNKSYYIYKIIMYIYEKIYWPDYLWYWIFSVIPKIFYIRKKNYDYIVSYYPCFSNLIAGYIFVKYLSNKKTIWIVDLGDPFSVSKYSWPNNYYIYKYLNIFFEKLIFKNADLFCVINYETKLEYEKLFGKSNKIKVVPHLIPDINIREKNKYKEKSIDSEVFILRYIGNFYKKIREPNKLVQLVNNINNGNFGIVVKLEIYGHKSIDSSLLNQFITFHGLVSRHNSFILLSDADIIVNIDNNNTLMTPSKITDYIAVRNFILNIANPFVKNILLTKYIEIGYAFNLIEVNNINEIIKTVNFIKSTRHLKPISDELFLKIIDGHAIKQILYQYFQIR